MITMDEYYRCIMKINPNAHVAICQDSEAAEPYPKWDNAHEGVKPTLKDCEAVLAEVQAEMAAEKAVKDKETLIQAKMREMAVDKLVEEGVLTADDKAELVSAAVTK